jgi:hypothetical protein
MSNNVVLLDLEHHSLSAKLIRDIIERNTLLYIFNGQGKFEFPISDLTALATWISCGQVVVLETLAAPAKEFEYAVIVGQLLALVELDSQIEVLSASESSPILVDMLKASGFQCRLTMLQNETTQAKAKNAIPSVATVLANPQLLQVKKYCDILDKMSGKPNTMEKLKNSVQNVLQLDDEQSSHMVGMLINLKIVKHQDGQISYRKKVLKQWLAMDVTGDAIETSDTQTAHATDSSTAQSKLLKVDSLLAKLQIDSQQILDSIDQSQTIQHIQSDLFKNFDKIDPVQMEVIQKLNQMKSDKPKDIYELRDLLERLFPQSDVRLLLKEMLDKGYIYWNGHAVIYSHEMFLN